MAVAVENVVSVESVGSVNSVTIPTSTAGGSDRAVVVGVGHLGNFVDNPAYDVVRGGSETFTFLAQVQAGATRYAGQWVYVAPAATTATIVCTARFGQSREITAGAVYLSGVDQTTPNGTPVTGSGVSTSPSISVGSASGDLVIDVIQSMNDSVAVGADQTSQWEFDSSGRAAGSSSEFASGTSTTMSWSTSGSDGQYAMVGTAFKPAGGTEITPDAVELDLAFSNPTIVVLVAPPSVELELSADAGTVDLHAVVDDHMVDVTVDGGDVLRVVLPPSATLELTVTDPAVDTGNVVTPDAVELSLTIGEPTVSVSIAGPATDIDLELGEPAIGRAVLPAPTETELAVTDPEVVLGTLVVPDAAEIDIGVSGGVAALAVVATLDVSISITDPAIARVVVPAPAVLSVTVTDPTIPGAAGTGIATATLRLEPSMTAAVAFRPKAQAEIRISP